MGTKNDAAARKARRAKVARLYLHGWTQAAIAEEVGCNQATVSRDLAKLIEQWRAAALADIDAQRAAELEKINLLEREYWAAWERSCETATESTVKVTSQGNEQTKTAGKTERARDGDPRWLAGVMTCIERRCRLLGIDAPERHDHRIDADPFEGLADSEVARLAANADRALRVIHGGC